MNSEHRKMLEFRIKKYIFAAVYSNTQLIHPQPPKQGLPTYDSHCTLKTDCLRKQTTNLIG